MSARADPPPARHLLFDLDGTLCDSREGIVRCLEAALAALGRPCPDAAALARCIGPPLQQTFRTLLGTADAGTIDRAVEAFRARFRTVGIFENQLFPGVPEALDALRAAGREMYVVTAKPQPFAEQVVEHFALAGHFRLVRGARLDGVDSDKATLIRAVVVREALDPRDVVMVGDREHDVLGARANGVRSLGVTWGNGDRAELEAAGADAVVDSLAGLVAHLLGRGR